VYTIPTETGSNHARDFFYYTSVSWQQAWMQAIGHARACGCAGVRACGCVQAFAKYTHVEVI
jgi:hypothetical protein